MLSALCIAVVVYTEARGEPIDGQFAVAEVIINRVADPRYPDDACAVAYQPGQFDGPNHFRAIENPEAWALAVAIADDVSMFCDGCNGISATHFARGWAYWMADYTLEGKIGKHVFYVNETPYRKETK